MSKTQTAVKLAAETGISPRTARRWLEGARIASGNAYALDLAAKKLGIERDLPKEQPVS